MTLAVIMLTIGLNPTAVLSVSKFIFQVFPSDAAIYVAIDKIDEIQNGNF